MRIAIAEDNDNSREKLIRYIDQYGAEHQIEMHTETYVNGQEIVDHYVSGYDVVFLDVEMPELDGMRAARIIRDRDESVIIVFVTNMAKYAVKGYEVGALDYILKPVEYKQFSMHMDRIVQNLAAVDHAKIQIQDRESIHTLQLSKLLYVEVEDHRLHYHTIENEYVVRGKMRDAERQLSAHDFYLCNTCYLVNLKYVRSIIDFTAIVGNEKLQISRSKKKGFIQALSDYMARNVLEV